MRCKKAASNGSRKRNQQYRCAKTVSWCESQATNGCMWNEQKRRIFQTRKKGRWIYRPVATAPETDHSGTWPPDKFDKLHQNAKPTEGACVSLHGPNTNPWVYTLFAVGSRKAPSRTLQMENASLSNHESLTDMLCDMASGERLA